MTDKLVKGSAVALLGTGLSFILAFFIRLAVIRNTTPTEYGLFSLAMAVFLIFVAVFEFGLQHGITRYISYFRGKKDAEKVRGTIKSAWQLIVLLGLLGSGALFFGSGIFSLIFREPALSPMLKILSVALFFVLLICVIGAIFRGFDKVFPKVLFSDVLYNLLILVGLIAVGFFGSFGHIFLVYAVSAFASFSFAAAYYKKKLGGFMLRKAVLVRKRLLVFSFPLFILGILNLIMAWTDTLMLGYFKSLKTVALYNAAAPLANILPIFLVSFNFIYLPIASKLYSESKFGELRDIYASLTKWVFSLTFPLFCILFIFPSVILDFLFGSRYASAAFALQILSFGFFFHALMGPNGMTLTAFGKPRALAVLVGFGALLNIALNLFLIPVYGLPGAASASACAFILSNVLISVKLYKAYRVHPFSRGYVKPLIAAAAILAGVYFLFSKMFVAWWQLIPIFAAIASILFTAIWLSGSLDKTDKLIFKQIFNNLRR